MPATTPIPLEEVMHRLDRAVQTSPCDETELVWIEIVRSGVTSGDRETPPHAEATVLVRVREARRIGVYQTGPGTVGELSNAVRQALGQTRIELPSTWRCPPAPADEKVEEIAGGDLVDRELATLEPKAGRELLAGPARNGEDARLEWAVGRVVLANSEGLLQQAAATSVVLDVRIAGGPGAGRATAAARSLEALSLERVFERAHERQAVDRGAVEDDEGFHDQGLPVVFSPEATASLLTLLNHHALSSRSFHQGTSVLLDKVGQPLFDPGLGLVDDGTLETGLPFPFDLFGYAKKPVDLIREGTLETPAVDHRLAERLSLSPTPHAVAPEDSRASHLRMEPGDLSQRQLLERAEGGLWIGWLERTECFDASDGRFRTRARGVRRIARSQLASGLPDLVWEGSLLEVFERLAGVGDETVSVPVEDGFRGAVTAPAIALPAIPGRIRWSHFPGALATSDRSLRPVE